MALHNYHNAHENKRLVSQRTSKLMWCQLVSEADHSLPFQREEKRRKRKRKRPRDGERKRISKTIHSDFVVEGREEEKKSGKDEGQAVNHSCRSSISALNASPCQNVMM